MISINPYYLTDLLSPITGLADDDDAVEKYRKVDTSSEYFYREIIKEDIKTYYNSLTSENKEKMKRSLNYYLSTSEIDFERIFESCLPPFDPPKDARDFFVWVWEELFGGEVYNIIDKEAYIVNADIMEPYHPK